MLFWNQIVTPINSAGCHSCGSGARLFALSKKKIPPQPRMKYGTWVLRPRLAKKRSHFCTFLLRGIETWTFGQSDWCMCWSRSIAIHLWKLGPTPALLPSCAGSASAGDIPRSYPDVFMWETILHARFSGHSCTGSETLENLQRKGGNLFVVRTRRPYRYRIPLWISSSNPLNLIWTGVLQGLQSADVHDESAMPPEFWYQHATKLRRHFCCKRWL